eukprot:CAMPEP_0184558864 /NCGR_PEP_ID=MMETSP0199_2-20130426/46125_1 /TAXON_ID=1112570 /ORGANISM="Thraustochytrium sp., Strain LLF1b" /LENGTH=68 /DNA_ID=CAMNT_0026956137 /DNA_START=677 /DNA_END=883 /DNA_ORIENTATION=-
MTKTKKKKKKKKKPKAKTEAELIQEKTAQLMSDEAMMADLAAKMVKDELAKKLPSLSSSDEEEEEEED